MINIDALPNVCESKSTSLKLKSGTLCMPENSQKNEPLKAVSSTVNKIISKFEELPSVSNNTVKPKIKKENSELTNQSELLVGKLIKLDSKIEIRLFFRMVS